MATESLKSIPIVNSDATPVIANTDGEGAPGVLRQVNGHVGSTTGVTAPSVYRLVRVPTNVKIKQILLTNALMGGASAADIEVLFSDSLTDGTPPSLSQLANPVVQTAGPADNKLFGSATSLVAAAKATDITFANVFTTDMQNIPLWQVLVNLGATQFSADPGGFFDIGLKSTATITTGGDVSLDVRFVV